MQSLIKIAKLLEKDAFWNTVKTIGSNVAKGIGNIATGNQFRTGYNMLKDPATKIEGIQNMLSGGAKTLGMYGTGLYGGYKMFS